MVVSCPTYQSYTSRKRDTSLEGVTVAVDSVSELPAYLVPACLLGTLAVIGSLALCLARDTVQATIATIGTVVLGRGEPAEVQTDGGEAAEMLRTDRLEPADVVRTKMRIVKGRLTDKIQTETSQIEDIKTEADMLINGEIGEKS